MDHSSRLIAAVLLAVAGSANAGYAQLKPPPGWSPGRYAPAANDATFGPVIHSPNGPTTTVGGQAVKMPAAYRLAANAPRIAAAAIFANPYVRAGAAIATWLGLAGLIWDAARNKWVLPDLNAEQSTGLEYRTLAPEEIWFPTAEQAVAHWAAWATGRDGPWSYSVISCTAGLCRVRMTLKSDPTKTQEIEQRPNTRGSSCPAGWFVTPAGCVQTPQPKDVNQQEFEDALNGKPMPERVPLELPQPTPLPIEQPSPWINPLPGPNPAHRPLFVPTGDPVPNPQYDPDAAPSPANQPFIQPGVRVVPSPTPIEPWRVDMQPVNRPSPTKQPMPAPEPEPVPDPQDPGADNGDKPKPEEQQSLCEKHPDIVACAKLGTPGEATPVPNEQKDMSITPESGFGPGTGSCPPPRTVQVAGIQLSMPFDLLCQFANGINPVVVGLAWLTAAFSFMGIGRRS